MSSGAWFTLVCAVLLLIAAFPRASFIVVIGGGAVGILAALLSTCVRVEWIGLP